MATNRSPNADAMRERVIAAATALLADGGREAVSTRAVISAARIQAPAIYRLFGDMQGLLDAVAADGLARHLSSKLLREHTGDPVEDLRNGWDQHVKFGLSNPALYSLMYGDPRPGNKPPGPAAAEQVLAAKIHRVAEAGRLRISETLASSLLQAAGRGTTLTLIASEGSNRDMTLSAIAREAVLAAIITDQPAAHDPGPVGAAVALRAVLPQATTLTTHERALMADWLDRIATKPVSGPSPR
jgi:AcrR family transcriptional regulator